MKAKVNDVNEFELDEISIQNSQLIMDRDELILRHNGINYKARILDANHQSKKYAIEINQRVYHVKLENELDLLIASMGMKGKRSQNVSEIKSPMPGLVFKLLKNSGDEVAAGDTILVLEAMKMENAIKSPVDGIIKSIEVIEGQPVDKGMVLIRF